MRHLAPAIEGASARFNHVGAGNSVVIGRSPALRSGRGMQCKAMGGSGTLLIFRMAFFILMLGLSVPVATDPYKDAQAAYDRGDHGAALRLNKSLSDQGHADAQNNLGQMFDIGQGVRQNYVQARMWFNLAGAGGNSDGNKNRDVVAGKMTPAQIAEPQRLATVWKPKPTQPR